MIAVRKKALPPARPPATHDPLRGWRVEVRPGLHWGHVGLVYPPGAQSGSADWRFGVWSACWQSAQDQAKRWLAERLSGA